MMVLNIHMLVLSQRMVGWLVDLLLLMVMTILQLFGHGIISRIQLILEHLFARSKVKSIVC